MKVLTRYLLRAHIPPFLFAFVALTGVILVNTLAKELANLAGKGLPLGVVFEFFVLSLPANIALTLPMAVLVSVLYTFSTLASENEITALRASGIDLRRAVAPLILAAALIASGMVWFNDQVLPASNFRWRMLMTDVAQTRPLLYLRPQTINPIRVADGTTPYYLEAQEIDVSSGQLRKVAIYDVSDSRVARTINADSGWMAFNEERTDLLLRLYDGDVREVDFAEPETFQVVEFREQLMKMDGVSDRLRRTAESTYRTDRDMSSAMMRARIDTLRTELNELRGLVVPELDRGDTGSLRAGDGSDPASGATVDGHVVGGTGLIYGGAGNPDISVGAYLPGGGDPDVSGGDAAAMDGGAQRPSADDPVMNWQSDPSGQGDPSTVYDRAAAEAAQASPPGGGATVVADPETQRYSAARARNIEYQIRELQVEIQKKYSIAGATLVFVLIGVPIALRFPRGGIGMVIAISLGIFGVYYVGLIGGETLGDEGYVPPAVAMWATNVIFGVLGLYGFLRLGREQGTTRGGGFELPRWLRWRWPSRTREGVER